MIGTILAGAAGVLAAPAVGGLAWRTVRQRQVAKTLEITTPKRIVEQRFVTLGGIDQWIQLRGEDRANPVLLVLHGGPGWPNAVFTPPLRPWERHFTVVQWDHRGAGKTLRRTGKAGSGPMTFDQRVADAVELVEFLRRHLGVDKVVLLAESMGTLTGLPLAKRRPDLVAALVVTDLYVNMAANEARKHQLTLERLRAAGNTKGIAALAVFPVNVVDEDCHRGQAVERGVWSPVIVGPQPAAEGSTALQVGAIEPRIGPLLQQGLVEPLHLAIGLGSIPASPLERDGQPGSGLGEQDRLGIGLGVIGQDPLDPYPVVGEEAGCLDQEQRCGGGRLVGEDLAEGDPRAVVHGRVDVVIADPTTGGGGGAAAVGAVAAAVGDAAQLLDVDVDQLAGMLALVAHDHPAGPVGVGKPAHPVTPKDPIDGRASHPKPPGQPMRPLAVTAASGEHATDLGSGEGVGATLRSRAAVGQPSLPVLAIAAQPLVGRGPRHAQGLGGLGWGPAELGDALDQQQPTELGQAGTTMGHEGPLPARSLNSPSRSRGPSTVNNAAGNYT
jgi:pimeloyl-ACP methyl ester carboxylesterase